VWKNENRLWHWNLQNENKQRIINELEIRLLEQSISKIIPRKTINKLYLIIVMKVIENWGNPPQRSNSYNIYNCSARTQSITFYWTKKLPFTMFEWDVDYSHEIGFPEKRAEYLIPTSFLWNWFGFRALKRKDETE
jgi:hypothetical protein